MEIPQFNSIELKNATEVKSSITALDPNSLSASELKDHIKQLLARKNYKLINAFDHSILSISPCTNEQQLFKALFEVLRSQLTRNTDQSNTDQLLIINKTFESILGMIDILSIQKVNLDKDIIIASFLGILIKNL